MRVFASYFAQKLDDLGCDGYAVDSDLIWSLLDDKRQGVLNPQHCGYQFAKTLPEFDKSGGLQYLKTYLSTDHHTTYLEKVLNASFNSISIELHNLSYKWGVVHNNAILNRTYDMHLPELNTFLLINNGAINKLIELLFRGFNDRYADQHYPALLKAETLLRGRELSEDEIECVRMKCYSRSDAQIADIKKSLLQEFLDEWDDFIRVIDNRSR